MVRASWDGEGSQEFGDSQQWWRWNRGLWPVLGLGSCRKFSCQHAMVSRLQSSSATVILWMVSVNLIYSLGSGLWRHSVLIKDFENYLPLNLVVSCRLIRDNASPLQVVRRKEEHECFDLFSRRKKKKSKKPLVYIQQMSISWNSICSYEHYWGNLCKLKHFKYTRGPCNVNVCYYQYF